MSDSRLGALRAGSAVALLRTDRPGSMGEVRRADTWRRVLAFLGVEIAEVHLLSDHRQLPGASFSALAAVAAGRAVPEALAWNAASLQRALDEIEPAAVVCVTSRAFHPLLTRRKLLLDFVDHLSQSYVLRSQAREVRRTDRAVFRVLAESHRRFEDWARRNIALRTCAGFGDSERMGAVWLPILAPPMTGTPVERPTHDLLFFGNLAYAPNIAAVVKLHELWPRIKRQKQDVSALIAGASPGPLIRELAEQNGWSLEPNFADVESLCAKCLVGVVPLTMATGMQTKVLEAAAHGLPQVISDTAAVGFGPTPPAVVASDDQHFVDLVLDLLDSEATRRGAAQSARQTLGEYFTEAANAQVVHQLLGLPR